MEFVMMTIRFSFFRCAKVLIPALFGVLLLCATFCFAEDRDEVLLSDDFSKGLGRWKREGHKVKVFREGDNKCIMIRRKHNKGSTFIKKVFKGYEGDLIFKARIKVEDFELGAEEYDNVKFQGRLLKKGKFTGFESHNLKESGDWLDVTFDVNDLTRKDETILMIGLQNAKGTIYIDDVEVIHVAP